jgi:hypothetical protein
VIAVSGDYTNTNFGGKKRNGKHNFYCRFQEERANNLTVTGFSAHAHSVVQTASD